MRHGIGWMLQIGVRAFWATAVRPPWSTGYAAAFSGADYARPTRAPEGQRSGLTPTGPSVTCRPALVALEAANTESVNHEQATRWMMPCARPPPGWRSGWSRTTG